MTMLKVKGLVVRYGAFLVLENVGFSLGAGDWLMLVGPNGAGKSTVVNALSQGVDYEGRVLFEERDIRGEKPKTLARNIGVLT